WWPAFRSIPLGQLAAGPVARPHPDAGGTGPAQLARRGDMTDAAPDTGIVPGAGPEPAEPAQWVLAARAFCAAVESGRLDLPLPGSGATWERWAAFADLAGEDLSLARLGEGHADAIAILAELGGRRPRPDSRWGVWAANPPGPNVTASRHRGMWVLQGTKQY